MMGFNVHFGLKSTVDVGDVFAVYRFEDGTFHEEGLDLLADPAFQKDFTDLFRFYKNASFAKFFRKDQFVYMKFHVGRDPDDFKAFKWAIESDRLAYLGNRSDHEVRYPSAARLHLDPRHPRHADAGRLPPLQHRRPLLRRDHRRRPDGQGRRQHRQRPGPVRRTGRRPGPGPGRRRGLLRGRGPAGAAPHPSLPGADLAPLRLQRQAARGGQGRRARRRLHPAARRPRAHARRRRVPGHRQAAVLQQRAAGGGV